MIKKRFGGTALPAGQGDASAKFKLGVMYDKGKGVLKDYVLAHMWTNLAAAQGVKEAVKGRDLLEKLMTLNQRAAGSIPARPTNKIKYLDPSLSTPLSVGARLVARPSGRKKTSSVRHGGDVCPPALNPSSWGYWTILELLRWKVPA